MQSAAVIKLLLPTLFVVMAFSVAPSETGVEENLKIAMPLIVDQPASETTKVTA